MEISLIQKLKEVPSSGRDCIELNTYSSGVLPSELVMGSSADSGKTVGS